MKKAYIRGYKDMRRGVTSPGDNPYPSKSNQYENWEKGWFKAFRFYYWHNVNAPRRIPKK